MAPRGGGGSGKRARSGALAPWDLPASKLLRNGKKSSMEDAESYEELWNYLAAATKTQPYKSELCSEDPIVRGVAISRYAQGWLCLCRSIQGGDKEDLESVLKPETYAAMVKEAKELLPHLEVLDGHMLPVRQDAMAGGLRLGGSKSMPWKQRADVENAVNYLETWCKSSSALRKTVRAMQLGGLFYTCHVDHLCLHAYMTQGPGKVAGTMNDDCLARLCQGKVPVAATPISREG